MKIKTWSDIKDKYTDTLILGNGASIAVCHKFKYTSLHEEAFKQKLLNSETKSIFDSFQTNDFEKVLHVLTQAQTINKILKINNKK
ncbi:DUF4917 family protein [Legionella sp. MW5194]|uniref:DUF4917 family protein n=1 Tax=Legionella sp. MW5194 TaxID=2662448 RepID=UPI00193D9149|nr:DUF4917 family protein [Legionella sp. MW5194]QRN02554.1 DUF4917 family protein [Legionella sp. MW5194]